MSDHVWIERDKLAELLNIGDLEAPAVYLALSERALIQPNLKAGLTLNELMRVAQVTEHGARRALNALDTAGHIRIEPKGDRKFVIYLNGNKIPYTDKNTDDTKLKLLEDEIRRLTREREYGKLGTRSMIRETCQGEERDVVIEVEGVFGRGLDPREAYWLGHAIARYGPERVKKEFRRMKTTKDPIRNLLGALNKGSQGVGAKEREVPTEERVVYREI